jgi:acyl-coenzyme A thioesterase PaaI-like protein
MTKEPVLRAIARNREPGFHFAGNLLDASFDHVASDDTRISMDAAPHLADPDGQLNLGALAMFADLAMAAPVRAALERHSRLATVSMSLDLTGAPRSGRLEAKASLVGFFKDAAARLGLSQVVIANAQGEVCVGKATFVAIPPPPGVELHPMPHHKRGDAEAAVPDGKRLTPDERQILRRMKKSLAEASFIRAFWGYRPRTSAGGAAAAMPNGPHIGNRVGHVQGGIALGLAAETACAALPEGWAVSGISGWYLSPGEGKTLRASAAIVHKGRMTALVRTQVLGKDRRKVIETMTTHLYRGNG